MNGKLNSEKRRGKNLLAQQQYRITHDFTMLFGIDHEKPEQNLPAFLIWWQIAQKQVYFCLRAASLA
ncbi:hypothetical protein ACO0K2_00265 [Undibacterium sp. MH2W]|uniref:hypothetical protein n=1 Tax=Undibacterium sp. MH2W TaxID=3413044 RepID=UPI003BF30AF4